jgi:hypothetical protein
VISGPIIATFLFVPAWQTRTPVLRSQAKGRARAEAAS